MTVATPPCSDANVVAPCQAAGPTHTAGDFTAARAPALGAAARRCSKDDGPDDARLSDQLSRLALAPPACPPPCKPLPSAAAAAAAPSADGGRPPRLASLDLEGVAAMIASGRARRIVVMAGAGISVSAGIPDFRTPGTGLYSQLQRYRLPYPEAVFSIDFFRHDPKPFYTLAKELFPGDYAPTPAHFFLRLLSDRGLLLRVFTQNIDGLEQLAGVPAERVVAAHGSFDSAHCIDCKRPASMYAVRAAVHDDSIATCDHCGGLVKPDIVFFGEPLPVRFHRRRAEDMPKADLLLVVGTSLVVQPFASMIGDVGSDVPRLLINRERVGHSREAKAAEAAAAAATGAGQQQRRRQGLGGGKGGTCACSSSADDDSSASSGAESPSDDDDCGPSSRGGSNSGSDSGSESDSSSGSGMSGGFDFGLPANVRDAVHLEDADSAFRKLAALLGWGDELEAAIAEDAEARAEAAAAEAAAEAEERAAAEGSA